MFRNCLAAALRHLGRNRLYTAISVLGLSLGLCTALLAGLEVRNQLSQDHFIAHADQLYTLVTAITPPGHSTFYFPGTGTFVGPQLRLKFSEIEDSTRLHLDTATLRRGAIEAHEQVYWADPNTFEVLPVPVVAGNLATALHRPDAMVLTRSLARKYFGRDAPIGETIIVDDTHNLVITAVIEDLPLNATHLTSGIFISALSPWTELHKEDVLPGNRPGAYISITAQTYLKLAPHASIQPVVRSLPTLIHALFHDAPPNWTQALEVVRLDRLNAHAGLNPGFSGKLTMVIITGFGVLAVAAVNFVNLLTARSARRAKEVSVRKLAGARRGLLAVQFLSESIAYVLIATLIAVALTELLLPYVNAFLAYGGTFNYLHEPLLLVGIGATAILLGVLAGAYPAFVLSAFRPLSVLRGESAHSRGATWLRHLLVGAQFAILIGLMISAAVVYRQRQFATQDALHMDSDQVLLIRGPCGSPFTAQVTTLPGVRGFACSTPAFLGEANLNMMFVGDKTGTLQLLYPIAVDRALFDLYGVKPIAGTLSGGSLSAYYIITSTAARHLGFPNAKDAIGLELPGYVPDGAKTVPVVGVVPDFWLGSIEHPVESQVFQLTQDHPRLQLISVKLTGQSIPQTLQAIDGLWARIFPHVPIDRFFLDEHLQVKYLAMLREAQLFGVVAAMGVLLSCLGLLGLAASIAERRTREIGIRKALGADTGNIFGLLLLQFAKPVLWANLLAWPVTAYLMHRWLEGFAYHIDLPLWPFPTASLLAILIALLSVSTHSILVARAKPVAALRYQ